jgi:hypothetical protein
MAQVLICGFQGMQGQMPTIGAAGGAQGQVCISLPPPFLDRVLLADRPADVRPFFQSQGRGGVATYQGAATQNQAMPNAGRVGPSRSPFTINSACSKSPLTPPPLVSLAAPVTRVIGHAVTPW